LTTIIKTTKTRGRILRAVKKTRRDLQKEKWKGRAKKGGGGLATGGKRRVAFEVNDLSDQNLERKGPTRGTKGRLRAEVKGTQGGEKKHFRHEPKKQTHRSIWGGSFKRNVDRQTNAAGAGPRAREGKVSSLKRLPDQTECHQLRRSETRQGKIKK